MVHSPVSPNLSGGDLLQGHEHYQIIYIFLHDMEQVVLHTGASGAEAFLPCRGCSSNEKTVTETGNIIPGDGETRRDIMTGWGFFFPPFSSFSFTEKSIKW